MDLSAQVLSDLTIYMKYAKYIPELKRREVWHELVTRNKAMHLKHAPQLSREIESAYKLVYDRKVLPSMRSLQFAGKPIELNPSRIYNCFSADTTFVTSAGVKSFADFNDGDTITVLTHSGNWKRAIVKNHGNQQLNKITIARGRNTQVVRATSNHRWILKDGNQTVSLSVGDKILHAPAIFDKFIYDDATPLERLYWSYGYVFGDGTCVKNNAGKYTYSMVRLCGSDKSRFLGRFEELGFGTSTSSSLNGDTIVYTGTYLKTAPNPEIDSPELIRAFVAGYLDADGSKVNDDTMLSKFNSIVATGESHQYVVEILFPIAGVFVSSQTDISGQQTNYGCRGDSKKYEISTNLSSKTNMSFIVKNINVDQTEEVWCLEVDDDASFVLSTGLSTGNCSFLPIDHPVAFAEVMFLLLSGVGVGYSVQRHHVEQLPTITKTKKTRRYLIGDSIEGWSDAVKVLVRAYFEGRAIPDFDFSDIRLKGARLITSGGKAPGPEPLKDCLHNIQKIFERRETGDQLTSIEVHDICCYIADAVLAGGIRRSAMIALFDLDDNDMLTSKFGDWYVSNPQRGRANNSAVILRHRVKKTDFMELWAKIKASGAGEPGFFMSNDKEWGLNPCAEISLRPFQFCNLTTIDASSVTSQEDLNERAVAASIIGTLQASHTNFHYLRDIWKRTTEKEALIGVSMTGIASGVVGTLNLKEAANLVKKTNSDIAKMLGINVAARTTTVKPEGTTSLVVGSSSGIHAWHNDYYIRRVRVGKNESIYKYLAENHPELVEDEYFKPHLQAVISVPQKAPDGAVLRTESAVELLKRVSNIWENWVDAGHRRGANVNNVSTTVSVGKDEWDEVGQWMWNNRNKYTALSVLPKSADDHSYIQAPFQDITKEEYEKLLSHLHSIDLTKVVELKDDTTLQEQLACAGGACTIESL